MIAKGTLKISWGRGGAVEGVRAKHPRPPEKKQKQKQNKKTKKAIRKKSFRDSEEI